ncbi:cell division protein FtsW, partial [Escherichia coli]
VIVMLLAFVVLLSSGLNYLYTLILGVAGIIGSMLIVLFVNLTGGKPLPDYVNSRFSSFLNPFADEYDTG